jgi:hypothetical protein
VSLPELQRAMREHLLTGDRGVAGHVRPDCLGGLAVYHHAYRAQLKACLRDTYERVWAWLGDEAFERASALHVEGHPPFSWTLNVYGHDFDETLAELYPNDAEVAELAWLDWAMRRAFEAADHVAVDASALADIDWEQAVFDFDPALKIAVMTTNAAAIWSALAEEVPPPRAECLSTSAQVRVWRTEYSPRFKTMDQPEARALGCALAGAPFAEVCEALLDVVPTGTAAEAAGEILAGWFLDGLITNVRLEPRRPIDPPC